jgi:hypothetical protein
MHGFDSFGIFDWLWLTVLVLLPMAFVLVLTVLIFRMAVSRMKPARGFEVKLNTGKAPVLREKDNDHG